MTPPIGEIIAEAMDKVGKEGVITVEESNTFGLELELTEGMRFDKGYISPYFVTDPERMEAVLDDPYILIVNSQDLGGQGPAARCSRRSCSRASRWSIIAEDVEGEALATLVVNKIRGTVQVGRRQGPRLRRPPQGHARRHRHPHRWPGHQRGGRPQAGQRRPRPARPGPQGRGHQGRDHDRRRCAATRTRSPAGSTRSGPRSSNTDSDYDREKLQERLAKLAGGVAVIKVGAATEVELKERKHRIEDAVRNAKAAVEEGIVARRWRRAAPGGHAARSTSST